MKEGKFELWTSTYAKIGCQMDYSLYPFDAHECEFRMRSVTKNMTFEGQLIRLKYLCSSEKCHHFIFTGFQYVNFLLKKKQGHGYV